ncbi:cytochrome c [Pollutimonas sp. H1-120]
MYSTRRPPHPVFIDPADRALVVQGKAIYANNCVACHGEALQGQPNWRERLPNGRLPAPPHDKTGHTWHHPDAMLFNMVKNGLVPGKTAPPGYESDMPAYGEILTDEEIVAVLAYIKSDWPSKVLQAQKEVTLQQRN